MKAPDDYDNNNDDDVENDDVDNDYNDEDDDWQKWQSTTNFYLNVQKWYIKWKQNLKIIQFLTPGRRGARLYWGNCGVFIVITSTKRALLSKIFTKVLPHYVADCSSLT